MSGTPTQAEVIRRIIDSRILDMQISMPGRIETYYPDTQTADVTPVIKRPLFTEDDDLVHEALPVVPNVQVLFPRGGGYSITWPLSPGDHVELVFQTYSTAQWRQSGLVSEPGDLRHAHLANAFAIPGVAPNAGALDAAQAGLNALVIEGPDIRLGKDATEFVALSNLVHTELAAIASALGGLIAPNGGGAVTGNTYTSAGNVAATKVKAK